MSINWSQRPPTKINTISQHKMGLTQHEMGLLVLTENCRFDSMISLTISISVAEFKNKTILNGLSSQKKNLTG